MVLLGHLNIHYLGENGSKKVTCHKRTAKTTQRLLFPEKHVPPANISSQTPTKRVQFLPIIPVNYPKRTYIVTCLRIERLSK